MINNDRHLQDRVNYRDTNFVIGALKNSFQPSQCNLMSSTKTTAGGWKRAFLKEVKDKNLPISEKKPVVTIVTGTHGEKKDEKTGEVIFRSAFTLGKKYPDMLDKVHV